MNEFAAAQKTTFQFECIPPAFIKTVIIIGIIALITVPVAGIYIAMFAPSLKIPAIATGISLGIALFILKEKWKDRYQFQINSASLTIQINNTPPPTQFAYSQIERITLSPFIDGAGNEVSKLSLYSSDAQKNFSIKILNQTQEVWKFLNTWQQALPVETKVVHKNGVLHTIEKAGEIIGGFTKSTDIARIEFINHACMK